MSEKMKNIPADEADRIKALRMYENVEEEIIREEVFDRLAALAALICNAPVAFIKLVGHDKQYIKASFGSQGSTMPRSAGICQYTILQDDVLEVRDSLEHELFKQDPDLPGPDKLRFYAGVPLRTPDGYKIGTLCVIDRIPGQLSESQKEALRTLADEIISRYELVLIQNKLSEKNAEKDALIKIVSHDIRNPLGGIISFSEMLANELDNPEHREMLGYIEKGGETILSIINLMLDSDYVRNKAFIVKPEPVDVISLTKKVIDLFKSAVNRKKQNLILEMDDQMEGELDKEKWELIVGNLLSNAIRFTPEEGTITIRLTKQVRTKTLLDFTITDTGIGMSEDMLEEIYSGKESIIRPCTEGKESTGFGMFMAKKYVSLLKGMIKVTSKEGKGTETNVIIPI
jgi:signal transduction histidine kinase